MQEVTRVSSEPKKATLHIIIIKLNSIYLCAKLNSPEAII
jgi:hypothetical protein